MMARVYRPRTGYRIYMYGREVCKEAFLAGPSSEEEVIEVKDII